MRGAAADRAAIRVLEALSMAFMHRLQWFDSQVRVGNYPSATDLASEFEISERQAYRDLEYLRDSLGAPLEHCPNRGGYRYTSETFTLPGLCVTREERVILANLASYYSRVASRTGICDSIYSQLARLLTRLAEPQRPSETSSQVEARVVSPYRAILESQRLRATGFPPVNLTPYWRGQTDGRATFEFHDPDEFIGQLLGSGEVWRVVWPRWLGRRLAASLERWNQAAVTQPEPTPALASGAMGRPSPEP